MWRNVDRVLSCLPVPEECLHLTESGSLVSRLPAAPSFRSQFSRFVSQKVFEGERVRERGDNQKKERGSETERMMGKGIRGTCKRVL